MATSRPRRSSFARQTLARAAGTELLHEGVRTDAPAVLEVEAFAGE